LPVASMATRVGCRSLSACTTVAIPVAVLGTRRGNDAAGRLAATSSHVEPTSMPIDMCASFAVLVGVCGWPPREATAGTGLVEPVIGDLDTVRWFRRAPRGPRSTLRAWCPGG
jgi:hypothetical protein